MRTSWITPLIGSLTMALAAFLASGCVVVSNFDRFQTGEARDAAASDGARDGGADAHAGDAADAAVDAPRSDGGGCGACAANEACCNGACIDVSSDPANCGACNAVCDDGAHGAASCVERDCRFTCDGDFEDCDPLVPGCESALSASITCGGCDVACTTAEVCRSVAGVYACGTECGAGEMNCAGTCANVTTDPLHCGDCTTVCDERPGSAEACSPSGCVYTCDAGRADCDGDLLAPGGDGCETLLVRQYPDADGDGFGDPLAAGAVRCPMPGEVADRTDCDDSSAARHPGRAETCDAIDNDCNLIVDDGFLLGGVPRTVGDDCTCSAGAAVARIACAGTTAVTCAYPTETCNAADDDCSGGADDTFACVRGATSTCTGTGVGACTFVGTATCSSSCAAGACVAPAETCDGADQNCDGFVDEGSVPFGTAMPLTGVSGLHQTRTAWRSATDGGALVASYSGGGNEQLMFIRFDSAGAPVGSPITVDTHAMYAIIGDVGWDGTQWVVMYSKYNDVRATSEILRVHVSASGTLTRPSGVVVDAESVAITSSPTASSLGIVTARYVGTGEMRTGTYAGGAFTRALSVLVATPILSRAIVTPAASGSFFAVGADATGIFYRRFDTTGALDALRRPVTAASTDVFSATWDGTRLVLLYRDGMLKLRGVDAAGSTLWTQNVRAAGFQGVVAAVDAELWVSLTDGSTFRARPNDGALFVESYARYCDDVLGTPSVATARALCFSSTASVSIGRCP